MPREGLPRTLFVVTCKPGKETRAAEEIMDLLFPYDFSVVATKRQKGIVVGTTALSPGEAADALSGKVTAYINSVLLGRKVCKGNKALKKGCLLDVEEGEECFCVGKALVELEVFLRAKGGVLKIRRAKSNSLGKGYG